MGSKRKIHQELIDYSSKMAKILNENPQDTCIEILRLYLLTNALQAGITKTHRKQKTEDYSRFTRKLSGIRKLRGEKSLTKLANIAIKPTPKQGLELWKGCSEELQFMTNLLAENPKGHKESDIKETVHFFKYILGDIQYFLYRTCNVDAEISENTPPPDLKNKFDRMRAHAYAFFLIKEPPFIAN